jgi:hypothetical protein
MENERWIKKTIDFSVIIYLVIFVFFCFYFSIHFSFFMFLGGDRREKSFAVLLKGPGIRSLFVTLKVTLRTLEYCSYFTFCGKSVRLETNV